MVLLSILKDMHQAYPNGNHATTENGLSTETELDGYKIVEALFTSERTSVERAIRLVDGATVILKRIKAEFADPGRLSRFSFSYDVLQKFDHPNIIKALGWISDQSRPAIVFEDSHSISLRAYLDTFAGQPLPLSNFLDIAIQVAEALSVIHYAQVIHKDLHPGNILIQPDTGHVQIIDFGLATLLSREQPNLTPPERIEGVLAYVSPEQTGRMNRVVDYRSDFYTLGVTCYELLAGAPPFAATDALGLVHAHIAKTQIPLLEVRADIPEVLSHIIDKLLNKEAENRYQSAFGLKKDLEKCREALLKNIPVAVFPLAEDDFSATFQVPQKLYGRKNEVNLLLRRFFQAAGGKPRLLAVGGYSGIGKSALINEVHKPIAAHNGLFLAGKFDQFQRNVPYSALQVALRGWLQQMLSLSEKELAAKRDKLINQLGANARVLIDFMPEFERVLGSLPMVSKLGAEESRNRFQLVFQQFVKWISYERPLVMFIDDIQWADSGTLNLLPALISETGARLLIIVAFRDNEVGPLHSARLMLDLLSGSSVYAGQTSEMSLGPLDEVDTCQLLKDTLHRPADEIVPLAALVQAKTAGNPFFISEFLKTLYHDGLLSFDLTLQRWQWSVKDIDAKGITDNVVELMLGKMQLLPAPAQALICIGACIGNRFDLDMVALVADLPLPDVLVRLWPALRDGLILQDGGDWFCSMLGSSALKAASSHSHSRDITVAHCRFLHDRMFQAAYESMPVEGREQTHLRIGRLLLSKSANEAFADVPFEVVEQLNLARRLITENAERELLAELNLQAASKSMAASVWQAAVDYCDTAIQLLPEVAWESHYHLISKLYQLKAEGEYLIGRTEASENSYEVLFEHLQEPLLKAQIYARRLTQSIGRGQWALGLEYGLDGLGCLGVSIPDDRNLATAIEGEKQRLHEVLSGEVISSLPEVDEMTDAGQLTELAIMSNLALNCKIIGKRELSDFFTLRGCNLVCRGGKSDLAAILLACYAHYLVDLNKWQSAYSQGVAAKKLADSYSPCREISNCYNVVVALVLYLKSPMMDCARVLRQGARFGLENGEVARAGICLSNRVYMEFVAGASLRTCQRHSKKAYDFLKRMNLFQPTTEYVLKTLVALMDAPENAPNLLDDEYFAPSLLENARPTFHYIVLEIFRAYLAYWCDNKGAALEHLKKARMQPAKLPQAYYSVELDFYTALVLASQTSPLSDEDSLLLQSCLQQLEALAAFYPPNFAYKYLLVKAELCRQQGDPIDQTCRLYRDAIYAAKTNGFIQYQALGCELLGEYWLSHGFTELAEPFIREAVSAYRQWGCNLKIHHLKTRHQQLLQNTAQRDSYSASMSETLDSRSGLRLDMDSVMKSAQAISSELQLPKLGSKVLQVIAESAGATFAALVIQSNDGVRVEAMAGKESSVDLPLLLDVCEELPLKLVRYVLHSDETVSIGNLDATHGFADDRYFITNQPRSVLCMPVEYRDECIGALYLENKLSTDAFTPDRLGVIKLLLAQAAISFENARLYGEVTTLNQTLERKVESRTKDLAAANSRLSQAVEELKFANEELNTFSYSVSHDLRSPLRGIKGFAQILRDQYGPLMDASGINLLGKILKSGQKMSDLIDGLLDVSRIQRRELALGIVDLSAMVTELFSELTERFPEQKIVWTCAPDVKVVADERMMYAVLENLINNACKYSGLKPISKIEFGWLQPAWHEIPQGVGNVPDALPPGTRVYFVKDNGEGFDMDHAQKLFGSFQRLHSEKQFPGTGIGLATVKRIIEKHGGNIWAQAIKGTGATFFFTLAEGVAS